MKKITHQYRQGDVLLTPTTIPAAAVRQKHRKSVILAEGEQTGHAHIIAASARSLECLTDGAQLYLRVKSPVALTHQEHGAATIEPGEYVVRRQVEQWMDEVRQVAD